MNAGAYGSDLAGVINHQVDPNIVAVADGTYLVKWLSVIGKNVPDLEALKGKKVGAIAGSAADEYLRSIGIEVTPFQEDAAEFAGISTGKVDVILEDDVKVLDYIKANAGSPIEIVSGVAVPEELIFQYGYGYARYATRPADCTLRMAYGVALHEIWGAGIASAILKKYGLSNRNLTYFPLD